MNNVTPLVSASAIEEQASLWVSRIDRGLTPEEEKNLCDWVQLSERHKQTLFEIATLWDDLSVLNELSSMFPLPHAQPAVRYQRRWFYALAASVAMVGVLLTALLVMPPSLTTTVTENVADTRFETGIGEQKPFTLPDGSVAHLNTDTLISVEYADDVRGITLMRGEAHFNVAHDPQRPLVVSAGNQRLKAVGTAFNVQLLTHGEMELLVTEGKVLVESASETVSQQPRLLFESGQKATIGVKQQPTTETLSLDQVQRDLAWQQGMLVFEGDPLAAALEEISRYTRVSFTLADDSLKAQRVAGYFRANDLPGLLQTLKHNFNIEHQYVSDNEVLLTML